MPPPVPSPLAHLTRPDTGRTSLFGLPHHRWPVRPIETSISFVDPADMSPSVILFLALFASQASVLVVSPILGDVAEDFDVSVAAAGQLRILAAPM